MASIESEQTGYIEKRLRVLPGKVALSDPNTVSQLLCNSLLGFPTNFNSNLETRLFPQNFAEQAVVDYSAYSILFVHSVDITSRETLQKDIDAIQGFIEAGVPVVVLMTDLAIIYSNRLLTEFYIWVNQQSEIHVYPRAIDSLDDPYLIGIAQKTLRFCESICKREKPSTSYITYT